MRFFSFLSMCMVLVLATMAQAEPSCTPSDTVRPSNYPGARAIPTTNNLLLPTGKAVAAGGQQLTIQGRVVDTHCAPVTNAVVELWQNSPTGRWLLAGNDDLARAGPVFAGAGRTYTDMDGNFMFITGFPAPLTYRVRTKKNRYVNVYRAPHVNIKISGTGIPDLSTVLFFSGDARNANDTNYTHLNSKTRSDTLVHMQGDGDALNGTIQLVIQSRTPYRTY